MARSLCVLVDRPPYGSIQPAEAIRHAMGAMGKGWEVVLALTGDGVYTALQNQSPPEGEWIPLSETLSDFIEEGKGALLVESAALEARGISTARLIQGARPAAMSEIAEALARCDSTLVF
jgi:sulfur relay (sulfurtransferase) complex TusBCD TusD component (DsrE family)